MLSEQKSPPTMTLEELSTSILKAQEQARMMFPKGINHERLLRMSWELLIIQLAKVLFTGTELPKLFHEN